MWRDGSPICAANRSESQHKTTHQLTSASNNPDLPGASATRMAQISQLGRLRNACFHTLTCRLQTVQGARNTRRQLPFVHRIVRPVPSGTAPISKKCRCMHFRCVSEKSSAICLLMRIFMSYVAADSSAKQRQGLRPLLLEVRTTWSGLLHLLIFS